MAGLGRICAFCGSTGTLSREHLWPKCLHARSGTTILSNVIGETEKAVSSEQTIRDVCTACNSGPLSCLDEYISQLYDSYFQSVVRVGEGVRFRFDFNLLLRWLLKIGYNTARARKWPLSNWLEFCDYVLGQGSRPDGCRVLLQLIVPTEVHRGSIKDNPAATEIQPFPSRVATFDVRRLPGFKLAFMVSLNSYYFYVAVETLDLPVHVRRRTFRKLVREIPGAYELSPGRRAMVYASSMDFIDHASQSEAFFRNLLLGKKWLQEAGMRRRR